MKKAPPRGIDGGRQRCVGCGHPRKEHSIGECSVPKCPCVHYAQYPQIDSTADIA